MKAQGYDRTIGASEDEFGRGFLVDNLYNQLMSLDAEWSVRVALNGDWGSGKSSIAEMIESRARAAGHPVGWLYPWRVNSTQNVASALMATVLAALEHANITLSLANATRKKIAENLKILKTFAGVHAAAGIGFSLLEDSSTFDAEFAKPIGKELAAANKRLLVIIDDLDRCEPAFLPPLLLFMRTAMDIPGFSFLAPFDSDIVAKTLHESNHAWANADRFLEKVFDFRVPIPDLTHEQKSRFMVSQLRNEEIYVSEGAVGIVAPLLPGTPRAIKALARDIALGKGEIDRRTPEEISWPLLLAVTILRGTSLEFFRTYRREVVDVSENVESWRRSSQSTFDEIWQLAGQIDAGTKRRVVRLLKALSQIVGQSEPLFLLLRRTFHFTDEHEPVTWQEFEQFVSRRRILNLTEAMKFVPFAKTRPQSEAAAQLASQALSGYQQVLDRIAHVQAGSQREERTRELHRGAEYLELTAELLAVIGDKHPDQRYDLFARLLVTEHHSDRSATDTDDLHTKARQLLETLCDAAGADWTRYDDGIATMLALPETGKDFAWSSDMSVALRRPMRDRAREELLTRLERTAGLDGLFKSRAADTQLGLMALIFLDPAEPFWEPANAPARFTSAEHRFEIQENAGYALGQIIHQVAPSGDDPLHWQIMRSIMENARLGTINAHVRQFLASDVPLRLVWSAYLTGRMATAAEEVNRMRSHLLNLGASPAAVGQSSSVGNT